MKKSPNRVQSLCDELENSIVNRDFKPGERLDESRLCEHFNVSRTPVREALRQLAATGLVEIIPNRGAFVSDISLPVVIEMFEVMAELEAMCGRLAARRINEAQKKLLQEKMDSCVVAFEQLDSDMYYYENELFHFVIYDASNNRFLIEQARLLNRRLKPYRRLQLHVPQRMKTSCDEHAQIVDAIIAGDSKKAELALKDHILIQGERFSDFVALINSRPD